MLQKYRTAQLWTVWWACREQCALVLQYRQDSTCWDNLGLYQLCCYTASLYLSQHRVRDIHSRITLPSTRNLSNQLVAYLDRGSEMAHPCTAQVLPPIFQGRPLAGRAPHQGAATCPSCPGKAQPWPSPSRPRMGARCRARARGRDGLHREGGQLPAQVRREPGPWQGCRC